MADVMMAMSGGVDSSVAAAMLIEDGHNVVGVTLKLWGGASDSGCCSVSDVEDARRVAQQLGIEHHVFNFGSEFDRHVIGPYVADHQAGRTPNPCVECNRHVKFDKLLRRADALGFDLVATGHHARIVTRVDESGTRVRRIARGADAAKDQSYVLYMLGQDQLQRLQLPLGDRTKREVRVMAAQLGLRTANKPDSQDVCFVHSEGGREVFLGDRIPLRPARVIDTEGLEVGAVESIEMVTLGQRRGLNLGGDEHRRYVVDIDHTAATVVVGSREDLMVDSQLVESVEWGAGPVLGPVVVQTSAHGQTFAAELVSSADGLMVRWDQPHQKVAPGQSVVFYRGDEVLGGAVAA